MHEQKICRRIPVATEFFLYSVLMCLMLISYQGSASEITNEPMPKGPFLTMPMQIKNIKLVKSHDLYRKWTFDRVFKNSSDQDVTFNYFEFFLDSSIAHKHNKFKIKINVEPKQSKTVKGNIWLRGGKKNSPDDLHFKTRGVYYGVDDEGKQVKAEYKIEQ